LANDLPAQITQLLLERFQALNQLISTRHNGVSSGAVVLAGGSPSGSLTVTVVPTDS
jgi:hypothetical protein